MQTSIKDVRAKMAALLQQAVDTADSTNSKMERLGTRSQEIRKVNDVINEIARTSNLLALNAMIEAARAGEVGAGLSGGRRGSEAAGKPDGYGHGGRGANETQAIGDDIGEVATAVQNFQEIIQQIEVIQNQLTSTIESQTTDLRGEGVRLDL